MIFGPIEELERQIDETRRALERTLRALHFELSPRHQLERAWNSTKDRTGQGVRRGVVWARANPAQAAMAAAAVTGVLYLAALAVCRSRAR